MKRMMVLLACILLCGGCTWPGKPGAPLPSTPTTEQTTEPVTTTTTLSPEEEAAVINDEIVMTFVTALREGDADTLAYYISSQPIIERLVAQTFTDCTVTWGEPGGIHRLHVKTAEDGVFPAGESDWHIAGKSDRFNGRCALLCPIDEDPVVRWESLYGEDTAVQFCYLMTMELELLDTTDCAALSPAWLGERGGTLMRIRNRMEKLRDPDGELPECLPADELAAFTRATLGVTVKDFSAGSKYRDGDVYLEAPGGKWYYGYVMAHEQADDTHTVTLRYFADDTGLIEAVTLRCTAVETADGYRLLKVERVSGGDYPPAQGVI